MLIPCICLAAFAAILYRTLQVASAASYRHWVGPRWRFWAFAGALSLVSAGALGVVLRVMGADVLIAVGAALYLMADRRLCTSRRRRVAHDAK